MEELIKSKLKEIEEKENIKILHCVESGSRAWGFASPDSDYDVRFIYVRPKEFYLRLDKTRDVIEWQLDDTLDINGWDLSKALSLLYKSNPTLFEWNSSPIVYEDNVSGKVTDSFYMELSHKYENEKEELKKKIFNLKIQLDELNKKVFHKEMFLSAIEKFMEMKTITAPLIRELIDHIEVHETEGEGKYKTQRIVIFYRFVGYIEIPEMALNQGITKDTRQGVSVSYIPKAITA